MFKRIKAAARLKLQRALAEVVEERLAQPQQQAQERHDATVSILTRLADDIGALARRLDHMEQLARRDISYALDCGATAQSAAFVVENMATVPVFGHPHDTLRYALTKVDVPGLALEFGVADGTTLTIIADALSDDRKVVGFDSFVGLPETWRTGFPAGMFAVPEPPRIPGACTVSGLFADTLPGFLAAHDEPIAFLHIDADLYSSAATVLDLTADRLAPGAVVVFDEFFNYPGWQQHEFRAWTEFLARTERTAEYLAYTANNEQVVARLT